MLSRSFVTKLATALFAAALVAAPSAGIAKPKAAPAPTVSPTPPPEDPAVGRVAKREFVAWQAGNLDRTHYTSEVSGKMSDDLVNKTASALGHLGAFVRSEYLGPVPIEDAPKSLRAYLYRMFCTNGTVYERLVLDEKGRVAGIYFMDKLPTAE